MYGEQIFYVETKVNRYLFCNVNLKNLKMIP